MPLAHIPHLHYLWLIVASLIAGVMNAMAGGGSFLSFPAMLGVGVLPVQANATNTVALWPGQLTSLATLRGDLDNDLLPTVGLVCLLGGVSGAEVLLHTRQVTFLPVSYTHLWSHYAASLLMVLGTPVLAIALVLVALERIAGIGVFDPAKGGDPLLFQHLFWFYSHPARCV